MAAGGVAFVLSQCGQSAPAVTAEVARATIRNVQTFFDGGTSARAAISSHVTLLAEGVLHTMIISQWKTAVSLLTLLMVFLFGGALVPSVGPFMTKATLAGTLFYDDFEDGNVTDNSPVSWFAVPGFPNTQFSVASGDLRVTASAGVGVAGVDHPPLDDTSIRAQVRLLGAAQEGAAVIVRGDVQSLRSYWLEVDGDGRLYLGLGGIGSIDAVATDLRPANEDVVLQLDVIGEQITAWAWRAGEAPPLAPQFSRTDNRISSGTTGVYFAPSSPQPQPTPGTALFRYVEVADSHIPIPEPGGMPLAAAGAGLLSGGLLWRRGVKRHSPAG